MFIRDRFHTTYCTNVHPGQDWASTLNSLKEYVPGIKKNVSKEQAFGLGLRLSNKASEELDIGQNIAEFKTWLEQEGLYVFTMNGFPYGNFHKEKVKDLVHAPDWTSRERVDYTKRLFNQLAYLIPQSMDGGISTSPISYKHWHTSELEIKNVFKKAGEHLCEIILHLRNIEQTTGKYLHLDIEPEPDGMLENSEEVLLFYKEFLFPIAERFLPEKTDCEAEEARDLVKRYINICYDVCHFSLAYEEPKITFEKFKNAGIRIGKIQISSALKVLFTNENSDAVWASLSRFNEPTYLHQVTQKVNGTVITYNDLPVVLQHREKCSELRAHFHVPIFLDYFDELYSTQDQILKVISYLKDHRITNQLEIETYTWDVLPKALKKDLSTSITREFNWLKEKL